MDGIDGTDSFEDKLAKDYEVFDNTIDIFIYLRKSILLKSILLNNLSLYVPYPQSNNTISGRHGEMHRRRSER